MAKEIDQLTTLLKEEWLKQGLDDELNRAERFGRDLGLLLIEPDIPADLKRDLMYPVLKKLGTLAKDVLRVVDVGVRIKDKLFFLLPETSVEGVEVATSKLAEKFHETTFVDASTGTHYKGRFLAGLPGSDQGPGEHPGASERRAESGAGGSRREQ
jgi:hypothetical protein